MRKWRQECENTCHRKCTPPIYLHLIFPILQFEISNLMNWIFFLVSTGFLLLVLACKNPDQTWNFKLENVKNQVQIENALGIGESSQMMCVFNGYVGEKNNALNFFFFCPGINHSDMNNQEFEFVEINYPGMNSTLQL